MKETDNLLLFLGHGTWLGKVRLQPLQVVFVDVGQIIQLGASTRRYVLRTKLEQANNEDEEMAEKLPNDQELEVIEFFLNMEIY